MAKIEAEKKIRSTYFFQLHGELYNVLEKEVTEIVFKIQSLGHDIGLHFDSHYFGITNDKDLEKYLAIDTQYFNDIFATNINTFSFHNTNAYILSCDRDSYAGLINVYSKNIKNNFRYCADSTGFWRFEHILNVLNKPEIKKLQILTHDAMWSHEVLSPRQRVFKTIDDNAFRLKRWYDKTLRHFGAKNVDTDKVYE